MRQRGGIERTAVAAIDDDVEVVPRLAEEEPPLGLILPPRRSASTVTVGREIVRRDRSVLGGDEHE